MTRAARTVVLATRNRGKVHELLPLLAEHGWEARTLDELGVTRSSDEDEVEVHATFADNAIAKAAWCRAATGLPALADDSGLEVAALGDAPGVRSRRWSGRDDLDGPRLDAANNALLLERLAGVADRRARFVCAAAFVDARQQVVRLGECRGHIRTTPAGGDHGFGYDPLFASDELGRAFSEVDRDAKAAVSHRARAFRALFAALRSLPAG